MKTDHNSAGGNVSTIRMIAKRACDRLGIPRYWVTNNLEELRMLIVRTYGLLPFQRLKWRRVAKESRVNLLFGCGETGYANWIGVDCVFRRNVTLVLDLRRPLPIPDSSVDSCYSEHFLEHLYPEEGLRHLGEVYRILKPGGRYRVVVPDAIRFVERYLLRDEEFFRLAFPSVDRPMQAIYQAVNWGGAHRNVLDINEIRAMASTVGFGDVVQSGANESDDPVLRIDRTDPQRVAESLYVELSKPTPMTA